MIKMKIKFNIVDYLIIILVICGVVFAFIHITSDDSTVNESTSYDSSTLNKITEKYLSYYRQGYVVNTTVTGYNSSDGKPVTISGNIVWIDDDRGSNVKALINTTDGTYLAGLYNQMRGADVYIDTMTLEVNGDKYNNLTEIRIHPQNITSVGELVSGIPNSTDYEISGVISLDEIEKTKFQEISNVLSENSGRISIKGSNSGTIDQINIIRATDDEITLVDPLLGDFNGITNEIVIRIYDCSDNDISSIEKNYNVTNIQKF